MEFTIERIGHIDRSIDGCETFFLVKSKEYATVAEVEEYFRERYCYSSSYPGAKFCDTVYAVACKFRDGRETIVTVIEQYDN